MMNFQLLVLSLLVVGCHVVGASARLSPVEALDALLDSESSLQLQEHHHHHQDQAALVRDLSSLTGASTSTSSSSSLPEKLPSFLTNDHQSSRRNLEESCPALPSWASFGTYWWNKKCVNHFGYDYAWKMSGCQTGTFYLDDTSGGSTSGTCAVAGDISVTVVCNSDKTAKISWDLGDSKSKIALKLKGGSGGTLYDTADPLNVNGGNYFSSVNHKGNYRSISHIEICVQSGEDCPDPEPEPPVEPDAGETSGVSCSDTPPSLPTGLTFGTYSGNPQCHSGGNHAPFGFAYGWKMEGCTSGTYTLDTSPSGGEIKGSCSTASSIDVTIACNSDKSATISWTGQGGSVMAVKVKGGNGGTLYDDSNNGGNYIAGINGGGNVADISHIEFCLQCDDCDPWTWGDPHFRTWHGKNEFEYHGECDLVFLKAPALDMDIHIRTTIRYDYSFVSQVVVRIGEDIFEVASWGEYQLNGMATVDLPNFMGSYPITGHKEPHRNKYRFKILLDAESDMSVSIVSFKDYVAVKIENGDPTTFAGSYGIMGDYETGSLYSRDGVIMSDPQEFAPEWQVRPNEDGILFSGDRYPQYPQRCVLPSPTAFHARKLGEAVVSREQAEAACASWKTERASCIQDVLKTNDLDIALMHED